jgi:hypothetical protein
MPAREVLTWLARRKASGTLSLSRDMIIRRFHLLEGQVTLASSSEQNRLLGQMLVDQGLIDAGQLEVALKTRDRYGERLGQSLALSGLVSERKLAAVLSGKVRDLLADAMVWSEGRFVYDDGTDGQEQPVVPIFLDLKSFLAETDYLAPVPKARPPEKSIQATDSDVIESTELEGELGS